MGSNGRLSGQVPLLLVRLVSVCAYGCLGVIMKSTADYNHYLGTSTTFSWWAYLPFLNFFIDPETFSIDFIESDFWRDDIDG